MTHGTAGKLTCGERRPGWENGPAIGIHRIPCVREADHQGDHANAFGIPWPQSPNEVAETPMPTRVCCRCKSETESPAVVGAVERVSGPAWPLVACPPCFETFRPSTAEY